jgi:CubicO group peptidase (beta-lactamase class C family)
MTDSLKVFGDWRASVRGAADSGWVQDRGAAGPYARASLLEWGSITKGLVGTTACLTLNMDGCVANLLPEYPEAAFTVADLVHHTSGLRRLPRTMRGGLVRDPYRRTVGLPLLAEDVRPEHGVRGEYLYSNIGYALLGSILDRVHGDWFGAVREHVLVPAGITTATVTPRAHDCIMPSLWFGRPLAPWRMAGSPYAASGGMWSTFEDLCRYADWALAHDAGPERTVSWRREAATTWINGEVRAAGVAIVSAGGIRAVAHALAQMPNRADHIATALVARELAGAQPLG